jgi:site-specific recombinase XerD
MENTQKLSVEDFEKHLEAYPDHRLLFGRKESGIIGKLIDLNILLKFFKDNKITHINGCVLLDFCAYIQQERHNQAPTMNRKISSIKAYLKFLSFMDVPGADDIKIADWSRARGSYRGPQEALTEDEVEYLLGLIDRDSVLGQRDYVIYLFMARLGLRIGEVRCLKFADIDLRKGIVKVLGKGRKKRTLPLTSDLLRNLRLWYKQREKLKNADQIDEVFISKKGAAIAERTIQDNFKKLIKRADKLSVEKLTPHSLRHAFASITYENSKDLITLKHILGHAKMASTEIYVHPSFKEMRRALNSNAANDLINQLLGGADRIHQATG